MSRHNKLKKFIEKGLFLSFAAALCFQPLGMLEAAEADLIQQLLSQAEKPATIKPLSSSTTIPTGASSAANFSFSSPISKTTTSTTTVRTANEPTTRVINFVSSPNASNPNERAPLNLATPNGASIPMIGTITVIKESATGYRLIYDLRATNVINRRNYSGYQETNTYNGTLSGTVRLDVTGANQYRTISDNRTTYLTHNKVTYSTVRLTPENTQTTRQNLTFEYRFNTFGNDLIFNQQPALNLIMTYRKESGHVETSNSRMPITAETNDYAIEYIYDNTGKAHNQARELLGQQGWRTNVRETENSSVRGDNTRLSERMDYSLEGNLQVTRTHTQRSQPTFSNSNVLNGRVDFTDDITERVLNRITIYRSQNSIGEYYLVSGVTSGTLNWIKSHKMQRVSIMTKSINKNGQTTSEYTDETENSWNSPTGAAWAFTSRLRTTSRDDYTALVNNATVVYSRPMKNTRTEVFEGYGAQRDSRTVNEVTQYNANGQIIAQNTRTVTSNYYASGRLSSTGIDYVSLTTSNGVETRENFVRNTLFYDNERNTPNQFSSSYTKFRGATKLEELGLYLTWYNTWLIFPSSIRATPALPSNSSSNILSRLTALKNKEIALVGSTTLLARAYPNPLENPESVV